MKKSLTNHKLKNSNSKRLMFEVGGQLQTIKLRFDKSPNFRRVLAASAFFTLCIIVFLTKVSVATAATTCKTQQTSNPATPGLVVGVCLTGTTTQAGYDVVIQQTDPNTGKIDSHNTTYTDGLYETKGDPLFTTYVPGAGSTNPCVGSDLGNTAEYYPEVVVSKNGSQKATQFKICTAYDGYLYEVAAAVPTANQPTAQTGSLSGNVSYDGTTQNGTPGVLPLDGNPQGTNAPLAPSGTLTGPGGATYTVTFDSHGNTISTPALENLPVGNYSFTVTWVPDDPYGQVPQQTYTNSSITITANQLTKFSGVAVGSSTLAPTSGQTSTTPTCESSGFSMNWIFCALYDGVSHASGWLLDNVVDPELKTSTICLDLSGASCVGGNTHADVTYQVWSEFRIYGDIFLVVVLLVVVIGESVGGGLIEAYTIKKVLPRLVAAAILINISIYIVAFLVDATNIIGGGVGQLITGPLQGAGAFTIHPSGIQAHKLLAGTGILAIFGTLPLISLFSEVGGSFILFVLVIPALLALISILVTIILRKAIILALIFVSPVAFALWCLPNTEKYFKKWWDLLFEMLLVYPFIVLIFAVSDVLSVTVEDTSGSSILAFILSFCLLFIPLILIPYAFRLAGQSIARIHEQVNGARKTVHEMGKGRRDRARQRLGQKITSNRSAAWNSGAVSQIGKVPGLRRAIGSRQQTMDQRVRMMAGDLAKDPRANTIMHNDDALRAATYRSYDDAVNGLTEFHMSQGEDYQTARAKALAGAQAAKSSIGFGAPQAAWAAKAMAATGTTFVSHDDVAQTIARAAGGSKSTAASLVGDINSTVKQAGTPGLSPGYNNMAAAVDEYMTNGNSANYRSKIANNEYAGTKSMDAVSILRGKPKDVERIGKVLNRELSTHQATLASAPVGSASWNAAAQASTEVMGQLSQLNSQKSYGSVEVQDQVNKMMADAGSTMTSTMQSLGIVTQQRVAQNGDIKTDYIADANLGVGTPAYAAAVRAAANLTRYSGGGVDPNNPNNPVTNAGPGPGP